jgi:SAM-dependent methyltransferase
LGPVTSDRDTYTFGDDDRASRRLARLAAAYEAETRELIGRAIAGPPALALDLGCGPGWTTLLVHQASGAARTVGVDVSDRFVAEARCRHSSLEFMVADIAQAVPVAGADFLFARFLLTHLARPADALAAWAAAAAPGARLALHETEAITSEHPALARYYELVAAMQAHHGQVLGVGVLLDGALAATGWRVIESRALALEKPAMVMAEIHAANLRTWRAVQFARDTFDPHELDALEGSLDAIAEGRDPSPPVHNLVRQVVAALDRAAAPDEPPVDALDASSRPAEPPP